MGPIAFSDVYPAPYKATKTTVHGKAQKASEKPTDNPHTLVADVHYKPTIDKALQIRKHNLIQSDATEQLAEDSKD